MYENFRNHLGIAVKNGNYCKEVVAVCLGVVIDLFTAEIGSLIVDGFYLVTVLLGIFHIISEGHFVIVLIQSIHEVKIIALVGGVHLNNEYGYNVHVGT